MRAEGGKERGYVEVEKMEDDEGLSDSKLFWCSGFDSFNLGGTRQNHILFPAQCIRAYCHEHCLSSVIMCNVTLVVFIVD